MTDDPIEPMLDRVTDAPTDESALGQQQIRTEDTAAAGGTGSRGVPSAAVILAGGRGSRLGGRDKPGLLVAGRTLLQVAVDAVGKGPIVVVGPPRALPSGVRSVQENPPGAGPAAAVATGLAALPELDQDALVGVLAADLPGVSTDTISRLCAAVVPAAHGALLVDPAGRRQYLTGVWRLSSLAAAVDARPDWSGRSLRELLAPLVALEVAGTETETADVDTEDDWARWRSAPG